LPHKFKAYIHLIGIVQVQVETPLVKDDFNNLNVPVLGHANLIFS
jgi:hypothetical protein